MFSFFSSKHHHTTSEVTLIFDIGSGSVGAAFALLSSAHKPILLATERAALSFQDALRARRLQPLMLRALSEATLSLLAEGIPSAGLSARRLKIADALYVLGVPWCASRTKTLSLTQKEPLRITEEVVSELVRHEDEHTEEVSGAADAPERRLHEASRRFERLLLSARLNGYETALPYGKEARNASFSFFESRAPGALLRAIADTVAHFVHPRRARFHSYALASFSALHELLPHAGDFLLADIGGEITAVLVVKKRTFLDTFSFPLGRNHLIRSLAGATGSSPSAALGLLTLARERQIHGAQEERVASALSAFRSDWLSHLLKTLARFSPEPFFPPAAYLSAPDDCADFFAEFIRRGESESGTLGSAVPVVTVLRGESFRPLLAMSVSGAATDSFLMLETVYANQLRKGQVLFA